MLRRSHGSSRARRLDAYRELDWGARATDSSLGRPSAPGGPAGRECDLAVNVELREHARDGERGAHGQHLFAGEPTSLESRPDRLLDLPLRRDAKALEELPELEVEGVLVHRSLPCARVLPLTCQPHREVA